MAACLVLAVAAAACTGSGEPLASAASGARPASDSDAGAGSRSGAEEGPAGDGGPWRPEALDWKDCEVGDGTRAECATLAVPLDWDDPSGPTIELALARIPAGGERLGSVVLNPGGPGGSGLEFLAEGPLSTDVAERFDQVSWDPRGVGRSTSVRCADGVPAFLAEDPSPDDAAEQEAIESAAAAVSAECGAEDGELLAHIDTQQVARDLEAIRLALGGEPLNYVGFSYGTHIGQAYAELFGEHVRTMVLDGVVDPAQGFEEFLVDQATAFEAAFDANARACAAAGAGACGVDDLAAAYDEVAARVEEAPLRGGDHDVGPAELGTAGILSAYVGDGWRLLGPALADALDGDGSALWDLASSYYDFGSFTAYAGVVCTDTPTPKGVEAYRAFHARVVAAAPRFGAGVANELLPCATWPVPATGRPTAFTAPDARGILVVGNTGDPATPVDNARTVAGRLGEASLVVADIDGHTAYGSDDCVTTTVDDYLLSGDLPADRDC